MVEPCEGPLELLVLLPLPRCLLIGLPAIVGDGLLRRRTVGAAGFALVNGLVEIAEGEVELLLGKLGAEVWMVASEKAAIGLLRDALVVRRPLVMSLTVLRTRAQAGLVFISSE